MADRAPLHLHEEIMLLALRDREGTVEIGSSYRHAIAGALVAELLLEGRVTVAEGRRKLLDLESDAPLGDPLLDECLERIATARRRASLQAWVTRFTAIRKLHHRVAEGLCRQRILRASEDKVLWLFTRRIYPEVDPHPERRVIDRLRRAIFRDSRAVAPRTVVLLSLAQAGRLLPYAFDKQRLKGRKRRIERLVAGELTGRATREAIQAAQAAVIVAAVIPSIAATAAH